ncbi:hypothetical protein FJTKL_12096 [Diaporthe vaccinii]|uniref:Uncharacterized protein n=1 Tax=Diaporthe vaccinii TaxID=105482 RepID=A0ABR4EES8_9PEZI
MQNVTRLWNWHQDDIDCSRRPGPSRVSSPIPCPPPGLPPVHLQFNPRPIQSLRGLLSRFSPPNIASSLPQPFRRAPVFAAFGKLREDRSNLAEAPGGLSCPFLPVDVASVFI